MKTILATLALLCFPAFGQYVAPSNGGGVSTGAATGTANTFTRGQAITGSADEVQLDVTGHSTQTNPIMRVRKQDGTVTLQVNGDGSVQVGAGTGPQEWTEQAAPINPSAGALYTWADSTNKGLWAKDSAGVTSRTAVPLTAVSNNFVTGLGSDGVFTKAQPSFSNLSGSAIGAQLPNPAVSTKGGVQSKDCSATSQFVSIIGTDSTVTCGTPAGGGNVSTTATNTYTSSAVNDARSAAHTLPAKTGLAASKPATCTVGEEYFASDATAGQNKYYCTATDTWTQQLNTGGGGYVIDTAGYFYPFGPASGGNYYAYIGVANKVSIWQFVLPQASRFLTVTFRISAALTAGQGLRFALYDASKNLSASTAVYSSTGTGNLSVAFSSTQSLPAGVYYFATTSDSTTVTMAGVDWGTSGLNSIVNLKSAKYGACANSGTGTGASVAFPATCGTITAVSFQTPILTLLEP